MDKLKPCPFCGSDDVFINFPDSFPEDPHLYWGQCDNCNCESAWYDTKEQAITAWNTRKGDDDA